MTNKSSFHVGGFWFHVTWDEQGKIGKDQHGDIWYNKANPRSEMGGLRPKPDRSWNAQPSNKDYFLYQRESRFESFRNR